MRSYFLRPPLLARRLMPNAVWNLKDKRDKINLSFDDGPHPKVTHKLLQLLSTHQVKATFFLLGDQIKKFPGLYDDIKSEGHQIGSHGYHHLDGWKTDYSTYIDNIKRGADIAASDLVRPPYGRISLRQYRTLDKQYDIVMWSLMTGDFDKRVGISDHIERLSSHCRSGDIIVLHEQDEALIKFSDGFDAFVSLVKDRNWSFSQI